MVKAIKGVLVQCDASIKSIILKADAERNEYIVEDLDDFALVVKENQLANLKAFLDQVRRAMHPLSCPWLTSSRRSYVLRTEPLTVRAY